MPKPIKKLKVLAKNAVESFDLPTEGILGYPRIEMFGNKSIIIEGVRGILGFEDYQIRLNCGKIVVEVSGGTLSIRALNSENMIIEGTIQTVKFE